MIQRIQSIYLFLVAICLGLTMVFPISTYTTNGTAIDYDAFGLILNGEQQVGFPLFYLLILGVAFALICIGLFKKRKMQLNFNRLNYLVILGAIVVMFINFSSLEKAFGEIDKKNISYGVGMFLPLAAMVFNFLASRGIKADEKLINSLDRLR